MEGTHVHRSPYVPLPFRRPKAGAEPVAEWSERNGVNEGTTETTNGRRRLTAPFVSRVTHLSLRVADGRASPATRSRGGWW